MADIVCRAGARGQNTVDVVLVDAGIVDGELRGLDVKAQRILVRKAPDIGLPYPGDSGVLRCEH
jgi:hypothetical protein